MNDHIRILQKPARGLDMIAGWRQWADAGDVSSGLPRYLVQQGSATLIGWIDPADFSLFQIPGTHNLLRPIVELADGYRGRLDRSANEFYLASAGGREFIVFLGTEPHRREAAYSRAFLAAVEALGVRSVVCVAGVHGPIPHWRHRRISCVYSQPHLRSRLAALDVRFSNYEGGATIGMVLAARAAKCGVDLIRLCAYVPTYDFSSESTMTRQMAMDEDYGAWRDVARRLNLLLGLGIELSDLAERSEALSVIWNEKIQELATSHPQLQVWEYLAQVEEQFDQESTGGEDDLWEGALRDLDDGDP